VVNQNRYFSITTLKEQPSTGDASRFIIDYSISDDEIGASNRLKKSIIVKLSRNAERNASFDNNDERAKLSYNIFTI